MLHTLLSFALLCPLAKFVLAQEFEQRPPVKVNVLNVCSPSVDEQKQISSALERVPTRPTFAPDFEVARGRSTLSDETETLRRGVDSALPLQPILAAWVRIRREFSAQTWFSNVQYSFSADPKTMVETLVMHVRDPKDLIQLSIEDNASSVTTPVSMLATSTPADRIRLERLGKPSIVLARCRGSENSPPPDQSGYEPLFKQASLILGRYRDLLDARREVPQELTKVIASRGAKNKSKAQSGVRTSDSKGK